MERRTDLATEDMEELIRINERERMAMELHDGAIQALVVSFMELERSGGDTASTRESLALVRRELQLVTTFNVSVDLTDDFVGKVASFVKSTERLSNIAILLETIGISFLEQLSLDIKICLYKILQEALSNMFRHSCATEAIVRFNSRTEGTTLVVKDNGIGFDIHDMGETTSGHFGLVNMRTRAERLGGSCKISSVPGAGTTITVFHPTKRLL